VVPSSTMHMPMLLNTPHAVHACARDPKQHLKD
jgi:hypothetical protein